MEFCTTVKGKPMCVAVENLQETSLNKYNSVKNKEQRVGHWGKK